MVAYTGADDESVRPLPLAKREPLFLLQTEHDDGEGEDQGLARACESYPYHVPATQTAQRESSKSMLSVSKCRRHSSYSHGGEPLHLNGCGLRDPLLLEGLQEGLGELHLPEGLDWRGHVLSLRQDVPLLAYALAACLWCLPDVAWGSPACPQGVCVGDPLGQLPHAHECTGLLDAVQDLVLLHTLLVQL